MASKEDYTNAANTAPAKRTEGQQKLVNDAYSNGMIDIKNIDHATQVRVKTYGE